MLSDHDQTSLLYLPHLQSLRIASWPLLEQDRPEEAYGEDGETESPLYNLLMAEYASAFFRASELLASRHQKRSDIVLLEFVTVASCVLVKSGWDETIQFHVDAKGFWKGIRTDARGRSQTVAVPVDWKVGERDREGPYDEIVRYNFPLPTLSL